VAEPFAVLPLFEEELETLLYALSYILTEILEAVQVEVVPV
jgi:hypothetical protein